MIFYADIQNNITTHRRVALVRMFKEAGLRSPRTQLTKVQIAISVQGRRTEASDHQVKKRPSKPQFQLIVIYKACDCRIK